MGLMDLAHRARRIAVKLQRIARYSASPGPNADSLLTAVLLEKGKIWPPLQNRHSQPNAKMYFRHVREI